MKYEGECQGERVRWCMAQGKAQAQKQLRSRGAVSSCELVAKLALLGVEDRESYRVLRAAIWDLVVANSASSDFPSNPS